jgi:hypothetical protein
MNWLKEHVYIAAWLSPVIAIAIALVKGRGQSERTSTFWLVVDLAFLSSLAVAFNPYFDDKARNFAEFACMFSFGAILFGKHRSLD